MSGMNISRDKISVIRVPFGLGGGIAGTEQGPTSILAAGLLDELKHLAPQGVSCDEVRLEQPHRDADSADTNSETVYANSGLNLSPRSRQDGIIKYEPQVRAMSERTADRVARAALYGSFPLVLGGDHSVAIGTLAGMSRVYDKLGVIWVDAHGDLNTEHTSPSGNANGMVLAIATGLAAFKQTDIGQTRRLLRNRNIVLVGIRQLDDGEKTLIRSHGIHCFTIMDIDRLGIQEVIERALLLAGNDSDGIHLSLDMDALDPGEAPGVGTPVHGGLTFREARLAMEGLAASRAIASMDIVGVNPLKDKESRTSGLAVALAAAFMGKRIL
jgi:arginase